MSEPKKSANEQLAELEKQEADIAAKKEALLAAAKEEDLKLAKMLIARHGFMSRDLQPELRVRGAAAKQAAAKKVAVKKAAGKKVTAHTLRTLQYKARYLLQQLKDSASTETDSVCAVLFSDLKDGGFVELDAVEADRLEQCVRVLEKLAVGVVVNDAQLRGALTKEEFDNYCATFYVSVTHTENEWAETRPAALNGYIHIVKRADLYNAVADRHSSAVPPKWTKNGQAAGVVMRNKATTMYERALEYLRGITDGVDNAAEIERWLDRSVSWASGQEPSIDAASVPRVRGSTSRYALSDTKPLWGVRRGKFWRQREAVTLSVLPLIYAEDAFDVSPQAVFTGKLQRLPSSSKTAEEC